MSREPGRGGADVVVAAPASSMAAVAAVAEDPEPCVASLGTGAGGAHSPATCAPAALPSRAGGVGESRLGAESKEQGVSASGLSPTMRGSSSSTHGPTPVTRPEGAVVAGLPFSQKHLPTGDRRPPAGLVHTPSGPTRNWRASRPPRRSLKPPPASTPLRNRVNSEKRPRLHRTPGRSTPRVDLHRAILEENTSSSTRAESFPWKVLSLRRSPCGGCPTRPPPRDLPRRLPPRAKSFSVFLLFWREGSGA